MKKLITTILLLISLNSFSQDSIKLRVTRVRSSNEKNIYWLKDESGNRYITMCECKRKKGDEVMIARKDLIIEKEVFWKKDIEN